MSVDLEALVKPMLAIPDCAPGLNVAVTSVHPAHWETMTAGLDDNGFERLVKVRGWSPYNQAMSHVVFSPEVMAVFAAPALMPHKEGVEAWTTPEKFGEIVSVLLLHEIRAAAHEGYVTELDRHTRAMDLLADQVPDGAKLLDLLYAQANLEFASEEETPPVVGSTAWAEELGLTGKRQP